MKVAIAIILAALMISAAIAITGRYRLDIVTPPGGPPITARLDTWTGRVILCGGSGYDQVVSAVLFACEAVDPSRVMAQQAADAAALAEAKALQQKLSESEEALSD